jgi:uncharacterized protein with von Willebrand factor type A (vWA) domain
MIGHRFQEYKENGDGKTPFEQLLKLFLELMVYTDGDVGEAIQWMNQLDREYQFTTPEYGMGDFIEDLKREGYLRDNEDGEMELTAKSEQTIRRDSLDQIFGKLRKGRRGTHRSPYTGAGEERSTELRPYAFGDAPEQIAITESLRNAQSAHGIGEFQLQEDDLVVNDTEYTTQMSTALMIDISHSMILYGEDRITPAKKTAMALAELITTRYPKDTLDILVFGDDAWQVEIKDLPYLKVGEFHTNTVAGLELAMDLLRRRKNPNKQIFMITDGKPSCLKEGARYYKNSWGLDRKIVNRCLNLAAQCRRLKIPITTFMIAQDPYLQAFVREFTETNKGRAFYSGLSGLGEFVFEDYEKNRRRKVR